MFFDSYLFILVFLPLTLIGYFGINRYKQHKAANWFLILMSFWFYGYFSPLHLGILVLWTLINYGISRALNQKAVKWLLTVGIVFDLSGLMVCKYYDFLIDSINHVSGGSLPLLRLALPLGLSFYSFQQIAYLVDSYRGETADHRLDEYLLFITFFPQLVQGPILLHGEFIPLLRDESRRKVDYDRMSRGLYGFSLGLAKKVLLADNLSALVAFGYSNVNTLYGVDALFTMLCYSLQIYFDFSGYCDMALGLSTMLGLEVPINFNSPYKAVSIADFWDRWHITLTRFFTRYIYIPLGGSRKGTARTYINVLIIFFISGLWHGAAWNFVVWGMMNGVAMVLYRLFRKTWDRVPKALAVAATFLFDSFAWSMFRAESVGQGLAIMKRVFVGGFNRIHIGFAQAVESVMEVRILSNLDLIGIHDKIPELFVLGFVCVLLGAVFGMKNTQEKMKEMKPSMRYAAVTVILMLWCILSLSGVTEYIYVNF